MSYTFPLESDVAVEGRIISHGLQDIKSALCVPRGNDEELYPDMQISSRTSWKTAVDRILPGGHKKTGWKLPSGQINGS